MFLKFEHPFKFKVVATGTCCLSVLFINVAIFTGIIIQNIVNRKINDQLVITPSNIDVWGEVPGKYNIQVIRNISLFNILNPEDIFTNNPIKVAHTTPILLLEKHITNNPIFSTDNNYVTFNQTYTYDVAMDPQQYNQVCNQNVTIANLFAMGAWDTAGKHLNLSQKAFYALGSLLTSPVLDDDIYYESLSLGVFVLYINRSDFTQLYNRDFQPAGIPMDKAQWIYNDAIYGWKTMNTIKKWVQAINRGIESDDAVFLSDYFNLSYLQLSKLFTGKIQKAVQEAVALIKDNYCSADLRPCDAMYLTLIQIGRQDVTMKPPPPAIPFPTLGMKNITVFGLPEFSYFYTNYFLPNIDNSTQYQNIQLSVEQCLRIFAIQANGQIAPTNLTIAHPITMDNLIRAGTAYDASQDITVFQGLYQALGLDSVYVVRVLYEWSKYLALNLASAGLGVMTVPTKSKWASSALSDNFGNLLNNLKPMMQISTTLDYVNKNQLSCQTVLQNTFFTPNATKIAAFCGQGWTRPNIQILYTFCNRPTTMNYQVNQRNYFGFSYFEMNLLCDKTDDSPNTMGYILNQTEITIANYYKCNNSYCSSNTLSLMQIVNGTITQNPMPQLGMTSAQSISTWRPDLFPQPFELSYFLSYTKQQMRMLTLDEALTAFYWDNFFQPLPPTKALADYYNGNTTMINQRFHFDNPAIFEGYLNYITLQVYLGGITFNGKICDLIWGFMPDVITKVRTTPPLFGGDPSTPTYASFNENNTNLLQTRYTGNDDINKVGNFYSTYNNRTVVMQKQFWDGVRIKNMSYNPWNANTSYVGGDANFVPKSTDNTVQHGYVSDLYRSFQSVYDSEVKKYRGMKAIRYLADPKDGYDAGTNPNNAVFNQFTYTGILNYTSPKQAPIFISKMLFNTANQSVINNIIILDNNMNPITWDPLMTGFLDVEPRTGVPFDLAVNFQINLDISKDNLLNTRPNFLIPVLFLRRTMDLTNDQVILP